MTIDETPDVLEGRLVFPLQEDVPSRFRRNIVSDIYWGLKNTLRIVAHEQHRPEDLTPDAIRAFNRSRFVTYHCTDVLWNNACPDTDAGYMCPGYPDKELPTVDICWDIDGYLLNAYWFRHDDTQRSFHFVALVQEDNAHIISPKLAYITQGLTRYLRCRGRHVEGSVLINAEPSQQY